MSRVTLLILVLFSPSGRLALALSKEDHQFVEFLIKEVRYCDTAARYLSSLEKSAGLDEASQAEVLAYRIQAYDCLGDEASKQKASDELKRKFPNSQRSFVADIDAVRDNLRKVLAKYDAAAGETDPAKAESLRAEGAKLFLDLVEKPLNDTIADLQGKIDKIKQAARSPRPQKDSPEGRRPPRQSAAKPNPELDALLFKRDQTELARIGFYLSYVEKLPEGSKERKELLEKALKLATDFVELRIDFPVMRYQGQLQLGILLHTLGRYPEAEAKLSVLYSAEPPEAAKPFPKELIEVFRTLRLQAILFGARSMNAAGKHERAAKIVQEFYRDAPKSEFDLSTAEASTDLRVYAVLVRLEYAIALAGSGLASEGLDVVEKVISKYSGPDAGKSGQEFVTDARKALGRIAAMHGISLRGQDYFQAGLGLKSDRKYAEAVAFFQRALSQADPRDAGDLKLVPLCLNEIAETYYLLKRYTEAALAYREIALNLGDIDEGLAAKVARNFQAMAIRAMAANPDGKEHAGLKELKAEAEKYSEERGKGLGTLQASVFDARKLEDEGKFQEARTKYSEVPPKFRGQKVPFYWYAQAKAWTCLYNLWDQASQEDKKAMEDEIDQAVKELSMIVEKAQADKANDQDRFGFATASRTVGLIHYQRERWEDAIAALGVFTDESAGPPPIRCLGLYSLVLAEAYGGKLEEAGEHYHLLEKECGDQGFSLSPLARAIADGYEDAGDRKKAAKYTLIYAKLPSSQSELANVDVLVQVAARLIDGGMIPESKEYVAKAQAATKPDDPNLGRQLIYLAAKVHAYAKKWNEVIAKLESYLKKYPPDGQYYQDPYVARDLAEAYMSRSKPKKPPLQDIREAERYYNLACSLMRHRRKLDAANEKTFWNWTLRLLRIKMLVGDAGDKNAFRTIDDFIEGCEKTETGDMGGLKAELLKLRKEAQAKLASA